MTIITRCGRRKAPRTRAIQGCERKKDGKATNPGRIVTEYHQVGAGGKVPGTGPLEAQEYPPPERVLGLVPPGRNSQRRLIAHLRSSDMCREPSGRQTRYRQGTHGVRGTGYGIQSACRPHQDDLLPRMDLRGHGCLDMLALRYRDVANDHWQRMLDISSESSVTER